MRKRESVPWARKHTPALCAVTPAGSVRSIVRALQVYDPKFPCGMIAPKGHEPLVDQSDLMHAPGGVALLKIASVEWGGFQPIQNHTQLALL